MGVGIKHTGERIRKAELRRAIWRNIEALLPGEFDYEAADEVVNQLCSAVLTVVEDMRNVGEFNRIGYRKRHWYVMELHISEDKVTSQNTLEGADCGAPPPAYTLWRRISGTVEVRAAVLHDAVTGLYRAA